MIGTLPAKAGMLSADGPLLNSLAEPGTREGPAFAIFSAPSDRNPYPLAQRSPER
jgi:hypothetical protein